MVNKYKGEVAVENANGEIFILCYPVNSIVALEELTGKDFMTLTRELSSGQFSIKVVRQIVWAGLLAKHPQVKEKDAGDLMNDVGINNMLAKISESFEKAFPNPQTGEAAGTAPANPSDGSGKISANNL